MRIAYVTPYYNGSIDGRLGRFHDWIHTAREDGAPFEFDVHAFTASNPDRVLFEEPHGYLGDAASLWGKKRNKAEFLLNARRVHSSLQSREYDVVHVLVMDAIVYPTVLSAVSDVPIVIGPDIAGWSPVRQGPAWGTSPSSRIKHRLKYRQKRLTARFGRYDVAVAYGEHHQNIMSSFGIPTGKISILKPGVNPIFSPGDTATPHDPPKLLYVGDFSEHKGYSHFLRALSRLDRTVEARVVGSGDPREDLIEQLGIGEFVTIDGFVPRGELPRIYRASDLVVIPSMDETAGTNVQFEALASGTPVVLADNPGMNEFTPEGASVVFSPRTVPRLVDALRRAIDNIGPLTETARRQAHRFHAGGTLDRLAEIYDAVIKREESPSHST